MKFKFTLITYLFFLCSAACWGNHIKIDLSPSMKVVLDNNPKLSGHGELRVFMNNYKTFEDMPNFTKKKPAPWYALRDTIRKVKINHSGVQTIGNYAFADCTNLKDLQFDFGSAVKSIGDYAFTNCQRLRNIYFYGDSTLSSIGNFAFSHCTELWWAKIPASVTSLGRGIFQGCSDLHFITVYWEKPLVVTEDVFAGIDIGTIRLTVPKGTLSRYQEADVWKNFKEIEEEEEYYNMANAFSEKLGDFVSQTIGEKTLVWIILCLSIALFIIRLINKNNGYANNRMYLFSHILFLTVCLLEVVYLAAIENDREWFCMPDEVGWFWVIVNFFLFAGVIYNQILCFIGSLNAIQSKANVTCNFYWGIVLAGICLVLAFLVAVFGSEDSAWMMIVIMFLLQLVQVVYFFIRFDQNLSGALWMSVVYLVGLLGTMAALAIFMQLLVVALLGLIVIAIALKSTGLGFTGKTKGVVHYADGSSENITESGRGITGETYYKGDDSGKEFMK